MINDRIVKVHAIAETVGILTEWMHNILTEHLDMKELPEWMMLLLTIDVKYTCVLPSK